MVVAVVGEDPYAEGSGDRDKLELSAEDRALIDAAKRSGKPLVIVLLSGRPLILGDLVDERQRAGGGLAAGNRGRGDRRRARRRRQADRQAPLQLAAQTWPRSRSTSATATRRSTSTASASAGERPRPAQPGRPGGAPRLGQEFDVRDGGVDRGRRSWRPRCRRGSCRPRRRRRGCSRRLSPLPLQADHLGGVRRGPVAEAARAGSSPSWARTTASATCKATG